MLNHASIQGHLTDQPTLKYFASSAVVANFAIANHQKVNGNDQTTFINCTLWGKQAEALANHALKGTQIIVEGQIQQEHWVDKQSGQKRSRLFLKAQRFHFCGSKQQQPAQAPQQVTLPPQAATQTVPMAAPSAVTVTAPPPLPTVH